MRRRDLHLRRPRREFVFAMLNPAYTQQRFHFRTRRQELNSVEGGMYSLFHAAKPITDYPQAHVPI